MNWISGYLWRLVWVYVALLVGCGGRLPKGNGSLHEITVIADPMEWSAIQGLLREGLERTVRTPREEKVFRLEPRSPEDFDFFKTWRNVLLVARLDGELQMAGLARSLLSEEVIQRIEDGEAYVFVKTDVWAKDQVFVMMVAKDTQGLEGQILDRRDELFTTLEGHLNRRVLEWLYKRGEQRALEQKLFDRYGWALRVPEGYAVEKELSEVHFVWMRKRTPGRWIFVWWGRIAPGETVDAPWLRAKRDEIGTQFYEGDRVAAEDMETSETMVDGKPAIQLSGLWENPEKAVGGPFRCYAVVDRTTDTVFVVDGAVYAPGIEKEPYLRQVDLIVQTFSTRGVGNRESRE